jgi:hypothetical protein
VADDLLLESEGRPSGGIVEAADQLGRPHKLHVRPRGEVRGQLTLDECQNLSSLFVDAKHPRCPAESALLQVGQERVDELRVRPGGTPHSVSNADDPLSYAPAGKNVLPSIHTTQFTQASAGAFPAQPNRTRRYGAWAS